jgi:hypothetical protein
MSERIILANGEVLTIAVDFDGVINSYKSGWTGNTLPDPPVPGAIEWLNSIVKFCRVLIHTARLGNQNQPGQEQLIRDWLLKHGLEPNVLAALEFAGKPTAQIYMDDRALRFTGRNFPTLPEIVNHTPWHEESVVTASNRVAQRYLEASDIRIVDVEIVGGQYPQLEPDPTFTSHIAVTFDISGMALTRLVGKQRRVIERFLEKLTEKDALRIISRGGSAIAPIEKAIKRPIENFVWHYTIAELDTESKVTDIYVSEDTTYWEARIEPRKQSIRYTIEFDVLGKWLR